MKNALAGILAVLMTGTSAFAADLYPAEPAPASVEAPEVAITQASGWYLRGDVGYSFNKLRGGGIVATVMSNLGLERFLGDKGLTLARTKVGDRYVVEHMRNHNFNVGGEQSGHIVLSDYGTTGDGLVAALQVLAKVKRSGLTVSEVCRKFEPVPQLLKNVRISGGKPLENPVVQQAIADAESALANTGRLVIRPSGTEPLIRVMAEGDDRAQIERIVEGLVGVIANVRSAA